MSVVSKKSVSIASGLLYACSSAMAADHSHHQHHGHMDHSSHMQTDAHDHGAHGAAPVGVMGAAMHKAGEWMLSYRYMHMDMEGNRIGDDGVSPDYIVANVANRFFGMPGQPAGLRIVPTKMTMEMHMLGAMYAPTDDFTFMLMTSYIEKSMDHITYNGMGTAQIGTFTTRSKGLGDTKVSGLFRLYDEGGHHLHAMAGISLPTGATDKRDTILTPMGMNSEVRLPYPMQLGSGTKDLLLGLTYTTSIDKLQFGAQYTGTFRTEKDNGYSLGDINEVTSWVGYKWNSTVNTTARVLYKHQDRIDGIDPNIMGPVQTANPDFHGGETVDLILGVNLIGQGVAKGHRVSLEYSVPVHRDLNGPQMETDAVATIGWQYMF